MDFAPIVSLVFQFLLVGLAFWTFGWNINSIFKNTLRQKQIEAVEKMREQLKSIWLDIYWAKFWSEGMVSLVEFESKQPENYTQYLRYRTTSWEVFYMLSTATTHYLIPKWIDVSILKHFYADMDKFRPFTIASLQEKGKEEILAYQNRILLVIGHLDQQLSNKLSSWPSWLLRLIYWVSKSSRRQKHD